MRVAGVRNRRQRLPQPRGRPADRVDGAREGGVAREPAVRASDVNAGRGRAGWAASSRADYHLSNLGRKKAGRASAKPEIAAAVGEVPWGVTMCGRQFWQRALLPCRRSVCVCVERRPGCVRLPELVHARSITGFGLAGGRLRAGVALLGNASRRSMTGEHNHVTLDLWSRWNG